MPNTLRYFSAEAAREREMLEASSTLRPSPHNRFTNPKPPMSVASDESRLSLAPGQVIGGLYRVVRTIHEGRNGVVVEAEQTRLGRRVAIKTLDARLTGDPAAQRRLTKEAELISKLEHPHIVQVLDFNRTLSGVPYLVMELLEGELLGSLLISGNPLDIPRALRIGSHVASALAAAHAKGIAHRKLNPNHVSLSEANDGTFARVIGFGVSARASAGQSGEHELVPSTRYLAYIPPEQQKPGGNASDELGDQYALGVLIYHMLTGFVPEIRGGVMSIFRRGHSPIDRPSAHRSGIPPALDRVLLRALSQDPAGRYPKISEFASALLEAGRGYLRRSGQSTVPPPTTSKFPPVSGAREFERASTPPARTASIPPASAIPGGARRASLTPSSLSSELAEVEGCIRDARAARNLEDAVPAVLRALALAEKTTSTQVERRISDNHRFFEEILQSYLAVPESILAARPNAEKARDATVLTPKRAFLLSRLDGEMTSGEVLQLSPLPRLETMTHLAELIRAEVIEMISR